MLLSYIVFLSALTLSVMAAVTFGAREERIAAFMMVVASAASPFAVLYSYSEPEVGVLLVDGLLLFGLSWLAMRSKSFWPVWAAGFQAAGLSVHFAVAVAPHTLPWIYAETLAIWSYPVMGAVFVGSLHSRKMRLEDMDN